MTGNGVWQRGAEGGREAARLKEQLAAAQRELEKAKAACVLCTYYVVYACTHVWSDVYRHL